MDLKKWKEERKKGMLIKCSRCNKSETRVKWIDHNKWKAGTMTMAVQPVIHKIGWKTIDRKFVCPNCFTNEEQNADYTREWYDFYYEMWKKNKEE